MQCKICGNDSDYKTCSIECAYEWIEYTEAIKEDEQEERRLQEREESMSEI